MSPTDICNMALSRFGAKRINDYGDASETKLEALYCRLFYEQTAKAMMRSHWWRFAKAREQLSENTTTPAFQWGHSFALPNDFLRPMLVYDGSDQIGGETEYDYELEGTNLLTDETTVYLKYIRWVPEVPSWDPLFAECLVLSLAIRLVIPLSQDLKLKDALDKELFRTLRPVRALDRQEEYHVGRVSRRTWDAARYTNTA